MQIRFLYNISLIFLSSLKYIELNIYTILTNGQILVDLAPISYTVATCSFLVTCHFQVRKMWPMYDNLNAYFIPAIYCYIIIVNLYLLNIEKLFTMLIFCYFMAHRKSQNLILYVWMIKNARSNYIRFNLFWTSNLSRTHSFKRPFFIIILRNFMFHS